MKIRFLLQIIPGIFGLLFSGMAAADASTVKLVNLLVQEGVLSREKAEILLKQVAEDAEPKANVAEPKAAVAKTEATNAGGESGGEANSKSKVIRMQYVPEFVKQEIRDGVRKDMLAHGQPAQWGDHKAPPSWLDRFTWSGDVRLRLDNDFFSDTNAPVGVFRLAGVEVTNTTVDRLRWRVRGRLNLDVKIADHFTAGVRLATYGDSGNPVSANQTLGDSDRAFAAFFDRVYISYKPYDWLLFSGGKVANPFFRTDMVWDPDLNLDGIMASAKPRINDSWLAFGTVGMFPIQEIELSKNDKWLFGGQGGVEWRSASQSKFTLAAAYYHYENMVGKIGPLNGDVNLNTTAVQWRQKGNTLIQLNNPPVAGLDAGGVYGLASEFHELNLTAQIDLATFNPVHVRLMGDYAQNLAFDPAKMKQRGAHLIGTEGNKAYQVRLDIGTAMLQDMGQLLAAKRHDWLLFGAFKRMESDSILDGFNDSEFRVGGTNAQGWIGGAAYAVANNVWVTGRWLSANQIIGPKLAIDVLQVDLTARF
jgi:hypothetical protein